MAPAHSVPQSPLKGLAHQLSAATLSSTTSGSDTLSATTNSGSNESSSPGHSSTRVADPRTLAAAADISTRVHFEDVFGVDDSGKVVSCFVAIVGEPHSAFVEKGPLEPLLDDDSFVKMVSSEIPANRHVLRYNDVRSAIKAVTDFSALKSRPDSRAHFTTAYHYCEFQTGVPGGDSLLDLDETYHLGYDGQVLVQARYLAHEDATGASIGANMSDGARSHMTSQILHYAQSFGEVRAHAVIPPTCGCRNPAIAMVHLEFQAPMDATKMVKASRMFPRGWISNGLKFWTINFNPSVFDPHGSLLFPGVEDARDPISAFRRRWSTHDGPANRIRSFVPQTTPSLLNSPFDTFSTADTRHFAQSQASLYNSGRPFGRFPTRTGLAGNDNIVYLHKIRDGTDIRTTVMLRNVPNRTTKAEIYDILYHWIYRRVDFMYLRKDFKTGLNVGYCFLNFIHLDDLAVFVEEVTGFRFPNSEKCGEVSYATMQGRESLVQKFRNSSVMREDWEFRPALLHTEGRLAGEEEDFPPPDNLTKMERSCQNATTVGLFSPARNRQYATRGGRRADFDRGNSFHRMEELERENRALRAQVDNKRSTL